MDLRRSSWLVVALGAVLLAGPLVGDAFAKRPRSRFTATVNGKRLKSSKRGIIGLYATTSFSVNGATKPKHGLVRSITVNCGPVDLRTVAPSTTIGACFGAYTESGSRAAAFRQWTGTGMALTIESFDGRRIVGTFRGTLDQPSSANSGDPPALVEDGSFSLIFTDTGV